MAVKNVIVRLGQSNEEGRGNKLDLPLSLRGPQANTFIFNFENNAMELLNVDGVGPNLPNNTTGHIAGRFGPEMSNAAAAVAALGEIYIFKFAVDSSVLGPSAIFPVWNSETATGLFPPFMVRWNAFKAVMTGLGHTIKVLYVDWKQGDSDCFVEGNDLAYYGLYKRFMKEVRAFVMPNDPLPCRWVSNLTHHLVIPSGPAGIFLVQRAKNVRSAQLRAGWDDANYRVYDSDGYSYLPDLIHLDSQGNIDIGVAEWNAYSLSYNNSMALEDYTLKSIRERLADDFGIDLSKQNNVIALDKKINDGIAWISNRRKNWPHLERDTSINVGETTPTLADIRYGAGIFTKSNNQVPYTSWSNTPISPREIVDLNGQGREGILCVSISSNTMLLKHGFRGDAQVVGTLLITTGNPTIFTINLATTQGGTCHIPTNVATFGVAIAGSLHDGALTYDGYYYATRIADDKFSIPVNSTGHVLVALGVAQVAREFKVAQAYFELPDDFIRNSACHTDEDTEENTVRYIHPTLFEREIRARKLHTSLDRIYSVTVDPLNINPKKYAWMYPYFLDRRVLHFKYFGDAKKLVSDEDVPDVPRSDRIVVLYAAGWFVAQWQKDAEMIPVYRDGALGELDRMTKEYQLADDFTENFPSSDDVPGIPHGPSGFPEFDEP